MLPERPALLTSLMSRGGSLVLIGLAIVLPLFRQTGARSWRTAWTEDAQIWFQQAHDQGPIHALLRGYAGYLQLPPRVLGALSQVISIRQLTLYFSVAGTVIGALLGWFVYCMSDGWITSHAARLALASFVVVAPVLGHENTATITNTIWIFFAVSPWALLGLNARITAVILRSFVVFLAATATPLTVVFLPWAIALAIARKAATAWVICGSLCVGLILQVAVVLHTRDLQRFPPHRDIGRLAELFDVHVLAQPLIGDNLIAHFWISDRVVLLAGVPIFLVLVFAALFKNSRFRTQAVAATFVAYAAVTFVVPVWGRGTNAIPMKVGELPTIFGSPAGPGSQYVAFGYRYSVAPVFMLVSAIACLIASPERRQGSLSRLALYTFVAQIVLMSILGFRVQTDRSTSPDWSTSVTRAYRENCVGAAPHKQVAVVSRKGSFAVRLITTTCDALAP